MIILSGIVVENHFFRALYVDSNNVINDTLKKSADFGDKVQLVLEMAHIANISENVVVQISNLSTRKYILQ